MRQYFAHNQDLYNASITDSLTGLYNRRFFTEFIETEYNRANRSKEHFSMVLLDLNNFKSVNDSFGHLEGDKVLKDIAEIVINSIRNYDVAVRYGGDEFVIILPNTIKEEAVAHVRRLEKAFMEYAARYFSIEFSVAFGFEDSRNKSLEDIYRIADELLYKKKSEQKNTLKT